MRLIDKINGSGACNGVPEYIVLNLSSYSQLEEEIGRESGDMHNIDIKSHLGMTPLVDVDQRDDFKLLSSCG